MREKERTEKTRGLLTRVPNKKATIGVNCAERQGGGTSHQKRRGRPWLIYARKRKGEDTWTGKKIIEAKQRVEKSLGQTNAEAVWFGGKRFMNSKVSGRRRFCTGPKERVQGEIWERGDWGAKGGT